MNHQLKLGIHTEVRSSCLTRLTGDGTINIRYLRIDRLTMIFTVDFRTMDFDGRKMIIGIYYLYYLKHKPSLSWSETRTKP